MAARAARRIGARGSPRPVRLGAPILERGSADRARFAEATAAPARAGRLLVDREARLPSRAPPGRIGAFACEPRLPLELHEVDVAVGGCAPLSGLAIGPIHRGLLRPLTRALFQPARSAKPVPVTTGGCRRNVEWT